MIEGVTRRATAVACDRATVVLSARPQSCGQARDLLDELSPVAHSPRVRDARLLVSELVANAILHGGLREQDTIVLEAMVCDARLRVHVADPGHGFSDHRDPDADGGGQGLRLVDRLSDCWGLVRSGRTHVWFEMDLG